MPSLVAAAIARSLRHLKRDQQHFREGVSNAEDLLASAKKELARIDALIEELQAEAKRLGIEVPADPEEVSVISQFSASSA